MPARPPGSRQYPSWRVMCSRGGPWMAWSSSCVHRRANGHPAGCLGKGKVVVAPGRRVGNVTRFPSSPPAFGW